MSELKMNNKQRVFLALGSNLGDKESILDKALFAIEQQIGKLLNSSHRYATEPWGFTSDQQFVNMVIEIETNLSPNDLLYQCLKIEQYLGRVRSNNAGYSSRTIDLDILFYNDLILNEDNLLIPHPHIAKRNFVLVPLCEIAQDFIHPVFQQSMKELLEKCEDKGLIQRLES